MRKFESTGASHDHRLLIHPENLAQHIGDLLQRSISLDRVEDEGHHVLRAVGCLAQRVERNTHPLVIARAAQLPQARNLPALAVGIEFEDRDRQRRIDRVFVHADDDAFLLVDLALIAKG